MTEWAAKVLEGVPRIIPPQAWVSGQDFRYAIMEADALAAIAKLGAGDGLVDRAEAFMATVKDYNYRTSDIEASPALITDLLARIAALTAERDEKEEQLVSVLQRETATQQRHDAKMEAAEAERDALRERVARLEWALRELVTCVEDGCFCSEMKMATAIDDALAALTDGGKDG